MDEAWPWAKNPKRAAISMVLVIGMLAPVPWVLFGEDHFCSSSDSMSMHMTGFKSVFSSSSTPCIDLFFSSWKLDSKLKFTIAAIMLALFAFCVEGFLCLRRVCARNMMTWEMKAGRAGADLRVVVNSVLFTIQALLGYLLMLAAMTYQIELLVYLLCGVFVGRLHFNADGNVVGYEIVDACCVGRNDDSDPSLITKEAQSPPPSESRSEDDRLRSTLNRGRLDSSGSLGERDGSLSRALLRPFFDSPDVDDSTNANSDQDIEASGNRVSPSEFTSLLPRS